MPNNKRKSWFKPYTLNRRNIERVVKESPGMYVLGDLSPQGKLKVKKIASSWEVKHELENFVGQFQAFTYKPFKHQLEVFKNFQQALF